MTLQHTPTPWTVERHDEDDGEITHEIWCLSPASYRRVVTLRDGVDGEGRWAKLDAAHIVRCVNAHDELVAALNGLISSLGEGGYFPTAGEPATRRAREALAKVSA